MFSLLGEKWQQSQAGKKTPATGSYSGRSALKLITSKSSNIKQGVCESEVWTKCRDLMLEVTATCMPAVLADWMGAEEGG